jgi:hypothetical protein
MGYSKGLGTTLTINAITIGQIVSIGPPAIERGEVETTDLDSSWGTAISTLRRAGEATLTVNYDPDATVNHDDILTYFNDGTAYTCKITLPSGPTLDVFTFSAFVKRMEWAEVSVDSLWQLTVTLRTTGSVALAAT